MNWLTSYWRPKIKDEPLNKETPENLWLACPVCSEVQFHKNWDDNLQVCNKCEYHKPLSAQQRLDYTLDAGYEPIKLADVKHDPIQFTDRLPYSKRLKDLRAKGLTEAIAAGMGTIGGYHDLNNQQNSISEGVNQGIGQNSGHKIGQNADNNTGHKVLVAAMDFRFIGGSMGMFVGQAIMQLCNIAANTKTPLICFTASGGARMQEGMYSLLQMPRTTLAVENLKEKGIPLIIVLTNPSMGGVLASFAMLGDITLAEPKATIGFSGRRVIEHAIGQTLPDGFQTSEFQHAHGFIDQIIGRLKMKHKLELLLGLLAKRSKN